MTDQQPQPDPTPAALDQPDTADAADTQPSQDQQSENANHEAAKWRTKLRETEKQRDDLATRLANMQRAQVDTHITAMGIKPAAVWASGAELADLVDEDGVPDEQKIKAAVDNARRELGIEPKRPAPNLKSGSGVPQERRDSWREAFEPRRER